MTKRTMKSMMKVIGKSCFVTAAIEGGKMYIKSEKKAFHNGNAFRKALAATNITILAVGIWEAMKYSNNIIIDFDDEMDKINKKEIEYYPEELKEEMDSYGIN